MSKYKIAERLTLPDDAATQTFAFIGRKGSGKTYAAGKLVELLLESKTQVVVLDTVGNWYGLRLAAAKGGRGFDVPVIGGLRGDIPIEEQGGALVADALIAAGQSAVLDVSQFSLAARQRFATAFGSQLWQRKKSDAEPYPLHLVIEESQLIVPQNVGREQARMVGIFEEIVRLGRNYGIGVSMITQRPQSVNKEVLNQAECLFVFQTNGAQERDALKKWIVAQGADVDLVKELPSLPVGEAYVWSPQWLQAFVRTKILPKCTGDTSATPKAGKRAERARELAPLDLASLRASMAEVVERAKENDPRALRRELAELRLAHTRELAELHSRNEATRQAAHAAADGWKEALHLYAEFQLMVKQHIQKSAQLGGGIDDEFTSAEGLAPHWKTMPLGIVEPRPVPPKLARLRAEERDRVAAVSVERARVNGHSVLPEGERAILVALATALRPLHREQITIFTGYKPSTRNRYLQKLAAAGYVTTDAGGYVSRTEAGSRALGVFEPQPIGNGLCDRWLSELPLGEAQVLTALRGRYPEAMSREDLSKLTGYKPSTRNRYLQKLAGWSLIVSEGNAVRMREELAS